MDEEFGGTNIEPKPARAFTTTELVPCPSCARTNAPTRVKCLYCGSALGTTPEVLSPGPFEAAGPGQLPAPSEAVTGAEGLFHVVVQLTEQDKAVAENPSVARFSQLTRQELSALLSGEIAPLATATSAAQAQAICRELSKIGLAATTISDQELQSQTPPKEIAGFAMDENSVTALVQRTGAKLTTSWKDVTLIVTGRLYFMTTEVEQSRRRKQVLDERQLTTDEAVFDLYCHGDAMGWRIRAGSFDFSVLGKEKKPTAFENFRALVEAVRRNASNAKFDEDYVRRRGALNKIWPLQETGTSWDRRRTAIRETRTTASSSDNELQFTRYSRLLCLFQSAQRHDDAQ